MTNQDFYLGEVKIQMMKKSKILFAESKGLCKLYLRKFGNDSKNTIITTFSIIAELPCSVIDTRNSFFFEFLSYQKAP